MNQYAPRKTVNIDPDVLEVLRRMNWVTANGQVIGAILDELDRDLTVRTCQVLDALGGKWNSKRRSYFFALDPRPSLGIVKEVTT